MQSKFISIDEENVDECIPLLRQLNPEMDTDLMTRRFLDMAGHQSSFVFGLRDHEDRLIAMATTWQTSRIYCGRQVEVDNVVVSAEHRGNGLGELFMTQLEEWALSQGAKTIELNTYVSNTASHRFYERLGFSFLGRHYLKEISVKE